MQFDSIRLAIIGTGRWGLNHVRTAHSILRPDQIIICDCNKTNFDLINEISSDFKFISNFKDLLNDESVNCAIVATPAQTHFSIAKDLLLHGKNVLVEKPITLFYNEAEELAKISKEMSVKLAVGHVLLYHPAILRIREGIDAGEIGNLQYIYSNRLNLGAIRSEENILWSFAPHDISIIQYFVGSDPISVFAKGADYVQNGIEDTTLTYLEYSNGVRAHIFVSWLHPFKEQRLVVIGENGMYVFEDTSKEDKLKYFSKGFTNINGSIEKFDKDFTVIKVENSQPLKEEQIHFLNSIVQNFTPLTDGEHAASVLKILEEATQELKK